METNAIVMDGKKLADKICDDLKTRVEKMKEMGIQPALTIVTASEDPASKIYVRNKIRRCEEIGIIPEHIVTPSLTVKMMEDICSNNQPTIVQMPFQSDELSVEDLGNYITARNDVDGFVNLGNVADLANGSRPWNVPCTPLGVMRLLDEYGIALDGTNVTVIGRSNLVGRPLARLLEQRNATVTICHSHTEPKRLIQNVLNSDVVVSATGCAHTLTLEMLENYYGSDVSDILSRITFVDVGINREENNKLCGDIDEDLKMLSYAYTPVPGGVGPMTVAMLMENTVEAWEDCFWHVNS